jgi:hypothetical protein
VNGLGEEGEGSLCVLAGRRKLTVPGEGLLQGPTCKSCHVVLGGLGLCERLRRRTVRWHIGLITNKGKRIRTPFPPSSHSPTRTHPLPLGLVSPSPSAMLTMMRAGRR